MKTKKNWMRSNEAREILRGSSCDLMHLRENGKLRFEKQGNAFLYTAEDVRREAAKRRKLGLAISIGSIKLNPD
jgi:hypothetical protein